MLVKQVTQNGGTGGRQRRLAKIRTARRRTELDIGCGHEGRFALAAALEHSDIRIIGIDINEHSFASAEAARRHLDIDNVEFVHGEARKWLCDHVPDHAIDAFHLYFPTPYTGPIRKHNVLGAEVKGWLFTVDFVRELQRVAVPGATLRVATDSRPYFENVRRVAAEIGLPEINWADPLKNKPLGELVGTGCERKMRHNERPINRVQYLFC